MLRKTLSTLALAALMLAASAPTSHATNVEISAGGALFHATSRSINPIMSERDLPAANLTVAIQLESWARLRLGVNFTGAERSTHGDAVKWDMEATTIRVGATMRQRLEWHLWFIGGLDLEAQHGALDVEAGGTPFEGREWAFGVHPRVGLELDVPTGIGVDFRLRMETGFAFRTDLAFDEMEPGATTPASEVLPLDLGGANLSGVTFNLSIGLAF